MKKIEKQDRLNIKKYSLLKNILYTMKNTASCYPFLFVFCGFVVISNIALSLFNIYLPTRVISAITEENDLQTLIIVTLLFSLSIAVFSGLKEYSEKNINQHRLIMNSFYIRMVARKGLTTDYCNTEDERFRKLQTESFNCCNGFSSPLTQIYNVLTALLSGILGFIVFLGILVKLNILVILFLIITTLVDYFLNNFITKWAEKNEAERIRYIQKINYVNQVSDDLRSAKDIRLYNMAVWLEKIYHFNLLGISKWYQRFTSKVFCVSATGSALSMLREGVAYIYLIYLIFTSQIDISEFVKYFGVITGFSLWFGSILSQLNSLYRINLSINYLRNYLEFPESYKRIGGMDVKELKTLPKTIELKNVCYRYRGSKTDTLSHINLKIHSNEHIAIVGLNGAGKTTLVKLICGLIDPTEGEVLYDGKNVKEYNREKYYQLFSAVFQQFSLMPVSIESNITGSCQNSNDSEKTKKCLSQSGLISKIESLPNGIKSNYSKAVFDDGVEFSGGEVQKLLLARALYKNAPIMILDEPTAALDPIAESNLYGTYHDTMQNKTAVFISHRLASTRFCDRILLFENGQILEEGTHESLLMSKGRYFELFETQAKYYREHPFDSDSDEKEEML